MQPNDSRDCQSDHDREWAASQLFPPVDVPADVPVESGSIDEEEFAGSEEEEQSDVEAISLMLRVRLTKMRPILKAKLIKMMLSGQGGPQKHDRKPGKIKEDIKAK